MNNPSAQNRLDVEESRRKRDIDSAHRGDVFPVNDRSKVKTIAATATCYSGEEEKSKKVRVDASRSAAARNSDSLTTTTPTPTSADTAAAATKMRHRSPTKSQRETEATTTNDFSPEDTAGGAKEYFLVKSSSATAKVWDLESALLSLVQLEAKESANKEYLTPKNIHTQDQISWVFFRAGHAGDASTIAQWYRRSTLLWKDQQQQKKHQQQQQQQNEAQEPESPELEVAVAIPTATAAVDSNAEASSPSSPPSSTLEDDAKSSMLEVWLADGLGDEDTPPAVHALMAMVHKHEKEKGKYAASVLGAVALLTLAWCDGERHLQVEWMHIDVSCFEDAVARLLEQRIWLRISALAHMTACQAITVNEECILPSCVEVTPVIKVIKHHPSPSAE